MAEALSIPDSSIPSLNEFKLRHQRCAESVQAMDKVPDDCFTYTYVPSTLGGIVEVRCPCGARWVLGDGEPYEMPADDGTDKGETGIPRAITHSVRILHLALTKPGIVIGETGERAVHDVESLWHGMELALFHADGCGVFDQIIMEWTSLLYEGLGYPEDTVTNMMRFHYSDAYLLTETSWYDILAIWDRHLCRYMWQEWPAIAEGARLPRPDMTSPVPADYGISDE